jgi:hypothetical protein
LELRLHTKGQSFQDLFDVTPEENRTYVLKLRSYHRKRLPKYTLKKTGWTDNLARWEIAYHRMHIEALFSTIWQGKLRRGPREKLQNAGVFCFSEKLSWKAKGYAIWVPLFEDGFFWRAMGNRDQS